jgi:ABC-type transport system substrate-binding protein
MAGWGFPYDQWPQDLKDQYAYNPTQAKALLTAAGYPNGFKTNVIADVNGDLTLLQVVQSDFAEVNIEMDIRTMDSVSWTSYVRTQGKTDQMAQKSGNGSLDIGYAPVKALTRFQTGLQSNIPRVSDPVYDAFIAKALAANTVDVVKQSVKDACEYEAQNHFVISLLQPMAHILCQPWLKGYTGQARSIWGPSTGPLLVDFYGSRIWIDQNLKKSKGR